MQNQSRFSIPIPVKFQHPSPKRLVYYHRSVDDDTAAAQPGTFSRTVPTTTMIYDVNSTLFRSFLRVFAAHGAGKQGKALAGPGEKKSDNKPVMNDM